MWRRLVISCRWWLVSRIVLWRWLLIWRISMGWWLVGIWGRLGWSRVNWLGSRWLGRLHWFLISHIIQRIGAYNIPCSRLFGLFHERFTIVLTVIKRMLQQYLNIGWMIHNFNPVLLQL
jgi:hypothetical protein